MRGHPGSILGYVFRTATAEVEGAPKLWHVDFYYCYDCASGKVLDKGQIIRSDDGRRRTCDSCGHRITGGYTGAECGYGNGKVA